MEKLNSLLYSKGKKAINVEFKRFVNFIVAARQELLAGYWHSGSPKCFPTACIVFY